MADATATGRLSAAEIFDRVRSGGLDELARPPRHLAFSALAAGLAMGISGLGVAALLSVLGHDGSAESIAYLAYPLGFLVVIIGRQQLFTENTLFPVALVLEERRHLVATIRLWLVVLAGNALGTLLFALLATRTPAVPVDISVELRALGAAAGAQGFSTVFWTAIVGGWLIALVAWLVTASTDTVGQISIIFLLTYVVGLGHFGHSVAGSAEVLSAVLRADLPVTSYLTWFSAAVLGNAVGGVVIVALFNYAQVHRHQSD